MEMERTWVEVFDFLEESSDDEIPPLSLPGPILPPGLNTGKLDKLRQFHDVLTEARLQEPDLSEGALTTEDLLNYVQKQIAAARARDPQNSGTSELAIDLISVAIQVDKDDLNSLRKQLALLQSRSQFDEAKLGRLVEYEMMAKKKIKSLEASLKESKQQVETAKRQIETLEQDLEDMEELNDMIVETAGGKDNKANASVKNIVAACAQTLKESDERFSARLKGAEEKHREAIHGYEDALAHKEQENLGLIGQSVKLMARVKELENMLRRLQSRNV